jgi:hypothetical protein
VWITLEKPKGANGRSLRFDGGSAAFRVPCLQRLLQASGLAIAAVHGTAIGQDGASIIVEAFDRRGPASARHVRFFLFAKWFGNRVAVIFGLRGAYHNFAAVPLWALPPTEMQR